MEAEKQQKPQRPRRKAQKRRLDDEAAASAAAAAAAAAAASAVSSPLGSADADDDNDEDDEGSAGPEICCRHSQAAVAREVRTQVDALQHCLSWRHADRATAKRATSVLAELAKNEEVVNVIVEGGAVPALVCHLKFPSAEAGVEEEQQPRPFEHEVEKGAAFALGLLAIKVYLSKER